MAIHRVYLEEGCSGAVGKSTGYRYEDGVLEISWCGEKSWQTFPEHTAVAVKCRGKMPEVDVLQPPRGRSYAVLWLCGVPRSARCATMEEYNALVEDFQRKTRPDKVNDREAGRQGEPDRAGRRPGPEGGLGHDVKHLAGNGWQMAVGKGPEGRDFIVAGWADRYISDGNARRMVERCGGDAPEWYVEQVLKTR